MVTPGLMYLKWSYSGTKTNKIVFTQPDPSIDGYKYRVILTIPSYVCEEIALDYEEKLLYFLTRTKMV